MQTFTILFGARGAPRLTLTVMAEDSCTALEQHLCLALPQERVEVLPGSGA